MKIRRIAALVLVGAVGFVAAVVGVAAPSLYAESARVTAAAAVANVGPQDGTYHDI